MWYNLRMTDIGTSIRLPRDFLDRADALVPRLDRVPEYAALGSMNRSRVLRLAILKGLEVLEQRVQRRKGGAGR